MLMKVFTHSLDQDRPEDSEFHEGLDNWEIKRYLSPNQRLLLRTLIKLFDIASIVIAFGCAGYWAPHPMVLDGAYLVAESVGALITCLCVLHAGVYTRQALRSFATQAKAICIAVFLGFTAEFAILWVLQTASIVSILIWCSIWMAASAIIILGSRIYLVWYVRHAAATGLLARRFAVVGATERGREIAEHIAARNGQAANHLVGIYDDPTHLALFRHSNLGHSPVLGSIDDLIILSRRKRIDAILIALPLSRIHEVDNLRAHFSCVLADVYVVSNIAGSPPSPCVTGPETDLATVLGDRLLINVMRRPLTDYQSVQKALFDRAMAAAALVILAPLLLVIAAAIKFDSRGPVFFRQPRMGFNNVPFTVLKFRSMYHHMTDILADRQTSRDDPRVTRVGRVLRKLSLDELPQLINVLLGDMSLVGPRPHAPSTKAEGYLLDDVVPEYAERHRIKPGITGWAQINGARGEIRSIGQIKERVHFDLHYIKNWSLFFDIKILVLTVKREIISSRAF